jgi:outer membrane protein, multidrug efflux system
MSMSIHKYFISLVLLFLAFSSCRMGKNYQRPELPLPKQFSDSVSYADTSSIADIEWKQFFNDTTLLRLIDKGIHYNYDLLLAVKRIGIAREQLKQAKYLWYPQVDAQFSGQYNYLSKNSLNGISTNSFLGVSHLEDYVGGVNLSWDIDIWGRINRQKEAALADYLQSYEAAEAVQTQVVSSIAEGFFNLWMLDRQLEIARQNFALNDTFARITGLLRDAGEETTLAVQQAESQKLTTAELIPQLEQSVALQENALSVLTGDLPAAIPRSPVPVFHLRDSLSTGLPVALVSRRPDVRAAEMALVSANAQVGVAQADMYPALNITAGGGIESFKASNWFSIPNSLFGLVTGTIVQPIFRRRELKTKFEIAKLQRESAVIEFRQSVLQAVREVNDALVQLDKLKKQEQLTVTQTEILSGAVFNAQLLFKSDMANYLEVIVAQASSLQAQLNLTMIRRQEVTAMVELYRALGGGWK